MREEHLDPQQRKVKGARAFRTLLYVLLPAFAAGITFMFYSVAVKTFLPKEKDKLYVSVNGRKFSVWEWEHKVKPYIERKIVSDLKMPPQTKNAWRKFIEEVEANKSRYFPSFPFIAHLFTKYPEEKIPVALAYFLLASLPPLGAFFLMRRFKKFEQIAFREPEVEPILSLGEPKKVFKWEKIGLKEEDAVRLFKSKEAYEELLRIIDKNLFYDDVEFDDPNRKPKGNFVLLNWALINDLAAKYTLQVWDALWREKEALEIGDGVADFLRENEKIVKAGLFLSFVRYGFDFFGNIPLDLITSRISENADFMKEYLVCVYRGFLNDLRDEIIAKFNKPFKDLTFESDADRIYFHKEAANALLKAFYAINEADYRRARSGGHSAFMDIESKVRQIPATFFSEYMAETISRLEEKK